MTRLHRVHAFCDWLEALPVGTAHEEHPGFNDFADLTDGEMLTAAVEMARREAPELADGLQAILRVPSNDDQPEPPRAA